MESLFVTAAPIITSVWPLMYFVRECIATSAPNSNGLWKKRKLDKRVDFCKILVNKTYSVFIKDLLVSWQETYNHEIGLVRTCQSPPRRNVTESIIPNSLCSPGDNQVCGTDFAINSNVLERTKWTFPPKKSRFIKSCPTSTQFISKKSRFIKSCPSSGKIHSLPNGLFTIASNSLPQFINDYW